MSEYQYLIATCVHQDYFANSKGCQCGKLWCTHIQPCPLRWSYMIQHRFRQRCSHTVGSWLFVRDHQSRSIKTAIHQSPTYFFLIRCNNAISATLKGVIPQHTINQRCSEYILVMWQQCHHKQESVNEFESYASSQEKYLPSRDENWRKSKVLWFRLVRAHIHSAPNQYAIFLQRNICLPDWIRMLAKISNSIFFFGSSCID